ncbi:MAG: crotonobetainyl-CoA--carnitine CoA-transferase [Desulfovibrio sp.]|nr:crotonobetainyl-CoA--carnitine CoA-transferase [Desulfovibrio sp.]MBI4959184.1 crotonobetainyl-CoA--carnitine CoA-transferase [Desulfovibrio sp.]
MKTKEHQAIFMSSSQEKNGYERFAECLHNTPLPTGELAHNSALYVPSKTMTRMLFFYELYKKLVNTHGVIIEFGVRWGQSLSILSALRGIFEPFNRHRKIIGFDTFEGFAGVSDKDGERSGCDEGAYSVPSGYEAHLSEILSLQEELNPISHLKKFELVKGDVRQTVSEYLARQPETVVSMAIFDLDIYEPTKVALEAILPHLCKGSILVFDELSDDIFPGETLALDEVLGLRNIRLQRFPMTARMSYLEIE